MPDDSGSSGRARRRRGFQNPDRQRAQIASEVFEKAPKPASRRQEEGIFWKCAPRRNCANISEVMAPPISSASRCAW